MWRGQIKCRKLTSQKYEQAGEQLCASQTAAVAKLDGSLTDCAVGDKVT